MAEIFPKITDYDHYASFLKARFPFLKRNNPRFSYGYCAKKIRANTSYLKHVLEGRRRIGLSRISKSASVFQLNDFEKEYFTLLVIRDLITDLGTQEYLTQVLRRLSFEKDHSGAAHPTGVPESSSFPLQNWLYLAIIELISFPDFKDDPEWIRSQLIDGDRLKNRDVQTALSTLLEKGILEKKKTGYTLKKQTWVTPDPYSDDAFKQYRNIVGKVWDVLGEAGRYRGNHFFEAVASINSEDEAEIFKAAEEFRDKVVKIAARSDRPSKLILISNNLLSLTK